MKRFIYLLLFLLSSCSSYQLHQYHNVTPEGNLNPYREIPFYVDEDFTLDQKVIILHAVAEMNHVLNGLIEIKIKTFHYDPRKASGQEIKKQVLLTDEGVILLAVNHDDPVLSTMNQDGASTLAFVDQIGNKVHHIVVIQDRLGERDFHQIILHEMGHALGALHVSAESLMFPYVGVMQGDCVDKITMLQIANYQHLDPSYMNYCSIRNLP